MQRPQHTLSAFLSIFLLFPLLASAEGSMRAVREEGEPLPLPLKHTEVQAEISGFVSRVQVVQTFHNPFTERIEAIYVFPLPDRGAVDSMTMEVGQRTIKGVIKKREEARQIYDAARNSGRTAALLDQERANIFTQSLANILPGETIKVTLTYVTPLEYDHGQYTFNFPMVVGPRYIPGGNPGRVPDASRISPPMLPEGARSGHDISLTVRLDAGVGIQKIESVSHDVEIIRSGMRAAEVRLKATDSIPNKDFILRYDVAGQAMQAGILTHRDERGGFFTLMLQPQADFRASEITAKEMFFVVDQSCSQSGLPMAKQKGIIYEALDHMNPSDTFNIVTFNSGVNFLAPKALSNTKENVARARKFVDSIDANGGTEMLQGVIACLDAKRDPERLRMVLFLTDGYVGNDEEIIKAVGQHIGDARMFTYGVGSSVNHYLLDRMAEAGRGYYQYSRPDEETQKSVSLFYERIAKPYLVDIELDYGDLGVDEVYPKKVKDLFAAQPIIVTGHFGAGGRGKFKLKGRIAGKPYLEEIEVDLPKSAQQENEALASMFGRAKIESFVAKQRGGDTPELVKAITETALRFRLMSAYTSFVAVDESVRTADGAPATIVQPVPNPEGTNASAFGGEVAKKPLGSLGARGIGPGGGGFAHAPQPTAPPPAPPALRPRADPSQRMTATTAKPKEAEESADDFKDAKPMDRTATKKQRDGDATFSREKQEPDSGGSGAMFLRVRELIIRGPISRADAQAPIQRALATVAKKLGARVTAKGDVTLKITLAADGTVKSIAVIHDGIHQPLLNAQLELQLEATKFAPQTSDSVITVRVTAE